MKVCISFLALVLLASPAYADTDFVVPTQKICGADKPFELGELVRLSVSALKDKPKYLMSSHTMWRVMEAGNVKDNIEDLGDRIIFGAGVVPKQLYVQCVCTYLYVVQDGGKVTEVATRTVVLEANIQIGAPNPNPPPPNPNPNPNPNPPTPPAPTPDPVFPPGTFGLAGKAYSIAKAAVPAGADRAKAAMALATAFRSMNSAINANTVTSLTDALAKTHTASNSALANVNVSPATWDSFGNQLQSVVYDLYKSKKIATPKDLAIAWSEVADGLEKVTN